MPKNRRELTMSAITRIAGAITLLGGLVALVQGPPPAAAADHDNLEEGLPVTIEDAFPIAYRGREVQGLVRYDNLADDPDGNHLFTLEPRFEFGAFRNFQAEIRVPYRVGSAGDAETGEGVFEGLYNFNAETLTLPAFALKAGVGVPFGPDTQGVETTLKGILTKTVGETWANRKIHLNASWIHKFNVMGDERDDRYALALGYSQPLRSDLLVVADIVREQELEEDKAINLLEAGLRWQMTPLTVLTAGVGAGFGEDSPDVRATIGFQHALTVFPLY
jgi:hypothetical protein